MIGIHRRLNAINDDRLETHVVRQVRAKVVAAHWEDQNMVSNAKKKYTDGN